MLDTSIKSIIRTGIEGLLTSSLQDTLTGHLLSGYGTVPVKLITQNGQVTGVAALAAGGDIPREVEHYLQTTSTTYGYTLDRKGGEVWLRMDIRKPNQPALETAEFCRIARQIIESAAWLAGDPQARACWYAMAQAADEKRKGD